IVNNDPDTRVGTNLEVQKLHHSLFLACPDLSVVQYSIFKSRNDPDKVGTRIIFCQILHEFKF
ncbi:MAG: hypothetical protein WC557_09275, partial [Ignavibacteriaceae bacterium]